MAALQTEERPKLTTADWRRGPEGSAELRLLTAEDVPSVVTLMTQSRFPVSGLVSTSIYTRICHDALVDKRVVVGVATVHEQVAAFMSVIMDWRSYWRSFALHHPLWGLRIGWKRLHRRGVPSDAWLQLSQEDRTYISSVLAAGSSGKSWSDSSPTIAKVLFVHVDPTFRGRRLGTELYLYVMRRLSESGITRFDAMIGLDNRPSIPLHVGVGFRLERDGNSLFATQDLGLQKPS